MDGAAFIAGGELAGVGIRVALKVGGGVLGGIFARVAAKGVLSPLGLGSTGRTAAANLTEQLAMKEIMSNPKAGKTLINTMKDASGRWNGWSKMSNRTAHGVEIHYNALWKNGVIKSIDDFKFIGGK